MPKLRSGSRSGSDPMGAATMAARTGIRTFGPIITVDRIIGAIARTTGLTIGRTGPTGPIMGAITAAITGGKSARENPR